MNAATQISTPVSQDAGWLVRSTSGVGTDYVQVMEPSVRCTCPSWVYRGAQVKGPCKHIRRGLGLKEVAMV